ncbi:hypothetical protein E2C01_016878 [Portunus trituberculatus]|uniref:Uncharacterized protein n=1 Tax=Portunus trituberculatus TaxID=210409 RepID=A0A5B7DRY5_PORTR|nr:hypothetical protein [Portunus trituberculatus]
MASGSTRTSSPPSSTGGFMSPCTSSVPYFSLWYLALREPGKKCINENKTSATQLPMASGHHAQLPPLSLTEHKEVAHHTCTFIHRKNGTATSKTHSPKETLSP